MYILRRKQAHLIRSESVEMYGSNAGSNTRLDIILCTLPDEAMRVTEQKIVRTVLPFGGRRDNRRTIEVIGTGSLRDGANRTDCARTEQGKARGKKKH